MAQRISLISLLVPGYDEAIAYYVGTLGFKLVEDSSLSDRKRWVVVRPGAEGPSLLLALADSPEQRLAIGNQTGGRVFLFLTTDDFDRDFAEMTEKGVDFLEAPRSEAYSRVAVFRDAFGNAWDLMQPCKSAKPGPS